MVNYSSSDRAHSYRVLLAGYLGELENCQRMDSVRQSIPDEISHLRYFSVYVMCINSKQVTAVAAQNNNSQVTDIVLQVCV